MAMNARPAFPWREVLGFAFAVAPAFSTHADCSLTNLGLRALPDLGFAVYRTNFTGGLYPGGANARPPTHEAAGVNIAVNRVVPRDLQGNVNTNNGRIVILSIGMSNTTQEWASKGSENFRRLANADPGKNPQLIIVDGAQGGQDAVAWTNLNAATWWAVETQRLVGASVSTNQVQVLWIKQALARPVNYSGGAFPQHAQALQTALEQILRVAKQRYPNLAIAYLSPRTRAYVLGPSGLNPETYAFESGFSVKWLIEKQLSGQLNYDPARGPAVAPWISWGPYLWADGLSARSDGFTWQCTDLESDFTHPSAAGGVPKVARQLLAFFKTDPTATPWFLRTRVTNQPPVCAPTASTNRGVTPLTVTFTANASDPDGTIRDYQWTFDDGTYSTNANPVKVFPAPGCYVAWLTVMDNQGNTAQGSVTVDARTTFALWRQAKFVGAQATNENVSGLTADADADGLSNQLEYLFGYEPRSANPPTDFPRAAIQGGYFTLTYSRYEAASDFALAVEASDDLITWSAAEVELVSEVSLGPTSLIIVRQAMPVSAARQGFLRLRPVPLP
jgi:hypothetical protein